MMGLNLKCGIASFPFEITLKEYWDMGDFKGVEIILYRVRRSGIQSLLCP